MSIKVFLTHTLPFSERKQSILARQDIELVHFPCLRVKKNPKVPDLKLIDCIIPSSMTAIEWMIEKELFAQHYYCIGPETTTYLQEKRAESFVHTLDHEPYTLKNLIFFYKETFKKKNVLWLGSQQGILKYAPFLAEDYPFISCHLTHWNWPAFLAEKHASVYFKSADFVICSSISSALVLSQLEWDCSAQLLLSSSRLHRYFLGWNIPPKQCSNHWLAEIVYN
jgi:hypothetical protein